MDPLPEARPYTSEALMSSLAVSLARLRWRGKALQNCRFAALLWP